VARWQQEVVDAQLLLQGLRGQIGLVDVGADAAQAEGVDADLLGGALHVADDVVRVGGRLADRDVAREFELAHLVLGEEAELAFLLQRDDAVQIGDPQDLAHVAAVGLVPADGVDLVQAAEDALDARVLDLADQQVGGVEVDAQDVRPVRFAVQRDEIVVRGHERDLGHVLNRVAGLDRDHEGVDLADEVAESDSVAFFQ